MILAIYMMIYRRGVKVPGNDRRYVVIRVHSIVSDMQDNGEHGFH